MFSENSAQILALIRSGKLVNIGGRPVLVPKSNPQRSAGHRGDQIKLLLAFAAIYIVWGSTYLAIRYAVETIPPLITAGIRHTVAGGVLLAWALARGYRPRRAHWIAGAVVGAFYFLICHGSLHWAEQHVNSGIAALLTATEPMFILLLAWASKQQKISRMSALGLAVGAVGVAVLTGGELPAKGTSLLGLVAVLVGALSWAAGVVVSPKLKLPEEAIARTAVPLVCGAAMLLMTAGITGEFHSLHWSAISLRSILGLAYLIVFGSIVAFTAYTWLLQRCPPTLVATHTYANPVVAVLLGWLLASEPLNARIVLASVAILGAILLVRRGERTANEATQSEGPVLKHSTKPDLQTRTEVKAVEKEAFAASTSKAG